MKLLCTCDATVFIGWILTHTNVSREEENWERATCPIKRNVVSTFWGGWGVPRSCLVNCQISPVIIFGLNTLRGTANAPAVDLLSLNILRGTKTSTPPLSFLYGECTPPSPDSVSEYYYNIKSVSLLANKM